MVVYNNVMATGDIVRGGFLESLGFLSIVESKWHWCVAMETIFATGGAAKEPV